MIVTKLNLLTSGTIDLYENVPLPLTYAIADIREQDKRNGAFSKTITIPGTKNNNKLLGHLYNIGINDSINVNIKIPCEVTVDSISVIKGNLQIARISKTQDDTIEYECLILANLATIFTEMGDAELRDLDLSAYNHVYNRTNQQNSWATSIKKNGADYAFTLGEGYVYPMIDYGQDSSHTVWRVENMLPAIYVKQYIDSIFAYSGFTYECDFFETDFFKRLIIPFSSENLKLNDDDITARQFRAGVTSLQTLALSALVTTGQKVKFNNDSTGDNTDPAGQYNTATWIGTVANAGRYNLFAHIRLNFASTPGGGNALDVFQLMIWIQRAGTFYSLTSVNIPISDFIANSNNIIEYDLTSLNILLDVGDSVFCSIKNTSLVAPSPALTAQFNVDSYFTFTVSNSQIFENTNLPLNSAIPDKVLMRDFFKGIIQTFNLYIETDKDVQNKLIILPRNDFYAGGRTIDWSTKRDLNSPLAITPMGELDVKSYVYTYRSDSDFWNKKYEDKYGYVYARRKVEVITDFLKGEKVLETIFAPTPCVNFVNTNRVTPAIYTVDSKGNVKLDYKTGALRLIYYGGMKRCNYGWIHRSQFLGDSVPLEVVGGITYPLYPYCGMVDDPYNPTVSLDFGVPREVYWNTGHYTNNNLYNKYYKQFLDEIVDNNSKLVTGQFYLTPKDIAELDFRNTIYIDGIAYRINKVMDYDPTIQGLTAVELFKARNAKTFTPKEVVIMGGENNFILSDAVNPTAVDDTEIGSFLADQTQAGVDGNVYYPHNGQVVTGQNNRADATASFLRVSGIDNFAGAGGRYVEVINSSGCIIDSSCKNISLVNSSGVVVSQGLQNVHVVNSGPRTVTESNIVYIGNSVFRKSDLTIRSYKANFIQSGTSNPVQTELVNTLGFSGQFIRTGVGVYELDLGAVIPVSNIFCDSTTHKVISPVTADDFVYTIGYDTSGNTKVNIYTSIGSTAAATDNALNNTSIEFHIFE